MKAGNVIETHEHAGDFKSRTCSEKTEELSESKTSKDPLMAVCMHVSRTQSVQKATTARTGNWTGTSTHPVL